MAFTVTVPITTKDGFDITSGAYIKFVPHLEQLDNLIVNYDLKVFKSLADFTAGKEPIKPVEIHLGFSLTITAADATGLNNAIVHSVLKAKIEETLGANALTVV
jgi:hypothetical protein